MKPVSVSELRNLFRLQVLLPGDAVLSQNPRGLAVAAGIRLAQYAALRDYPFRRLTRREAWDAAQFGHAMITIGEDGIAEQTLPRCGVRSWEQLAGCELVFLRWRAELAPGVDLTQRAHAAVAFALTDVKAGVKYPTQELLYYGKWFLKTARGRKFAETFDNGNDAHGVCSAQLLWWYLQAGIPVQDAQPNAWYPARYLVDAQLQVIARIKLKR